LLLAFGLSVILIFVGCGFPEVMPSTASSCSVFSSTRSRRALRSFSEFLDGLAVTLLGKRVDV
jgi:hypothetical protein